MCGSYRAFKLILSLVPISFAVDNGYAGNISSGKLLMCLMWLSDYWLILESFESSSKTHGCNNSCLMELIYALRADCHKPHRGN